MSSKKVVAAWSLLLGAVVGAGVAAERPIVAPGTRFEMLTTDVDFCEGPAAGLDGAIYFSDIPTGRKKGRILRYDPASDKLSVYRADSGKTNGLFIDAKGRLVACEGADFGGRRISRQKIGSKAETVVDTFRGKKFNAPNDLCVDGKGRIWFSDPKYLGDEPRELDHRSVYRIDPDGSLHLAITQPHVEKPNGVHVSLDGKTLYVADTNNEPVKQADGTKRPGAMRLVAFEIGSDGSIGKKRLLVDFAPGPGVDGMTLDEKGRIYAAVRNKEKPGIRVYTPQGKQVAFIPMPDVPTNCIFGRGKEADRLYVTMDTGFGRIRLNAKGHHLATE